MAARELDIPANPIKAERPHRCLKICEFTYWNGSASLQEISEILLKLPTLTEVGATVIEDDIRQLARHGLPIPLGSDGRWRIDGLLPGFALRLRRHEASALWAWCVARAPTTSNSMIQAPNPELEAAILVLEDGLTKFHPDNQILTKIDYNIMLQKSEDSQTLIPPIYAYDIHNKAQLVHQRLHIVDLIENRTTLDANQLTTALNVSYQTIHNDLTILRAVGIEARYGRRRQEYFIVGLNHCLANHLSLEMASAIINFFEEPSATGQGDVHAAQLRRASRKLTQGIRLMFGQQGRILGDLLSYN